MKAARWVSTLFVAGTLFMGAMTASVVPSGAETKGNRSCYDFDSCVSNCQRRQSKASCLKRCKRMHNDLNVDKECGTPCGPVRCQAGQVCCNASCGICTEPGGFCIALHCPSK
ncbi:MAG: hypothetical protein HY391_02180 [Deltaproteobacteria bacterium]|nr:hypothetical protein [Deltaproteobacteria bacterium]